MAKNRKLLGLIPPGEILLEEFMKPMGISINRLALTADRSARRIFGCGSVALCKYKSLRRATRSMARNRSTFMSLKSASVSEHRKERITKDRLFRCT